MKWLTPEWARGQLSDKEARDATKAYQARLTELAHAATGPVSDLAKSVDHRLDMSDGIIDSIEIDQPNRLIVLRLVQGSLQHEYGLLELVAPDGRIEAPSVPRLRDITTNRDTEIWYWELDLQANDADRYELRFLCWPEGEFSIAFGELDWSWTARSDRMVPPPKREVGIRD